MQAKCDATFPQAQDSGLEAEGLLHYRMSQLALQNETPPQSNAKPKPNKQMPMNEPKDGNIATKIF